MINCHPEDDMIYKLPRFEGLELIVDCGRDTLIKIHLKKVPQQPLNSISPLW